MTSRLEPLAILAFATNVIIPSALCRGYQAYVTSWYRPGPTRHRLGLAVDVAIDARAALTEGDSARSPELQAAPAIRDWLLDTLIEWAATPTSALTVLPRFATNVISTTGVAVLVEHDHLHLEIPPEADEVRGRVSLGTYADAAAASARDTIFPYVIDWFAEKVQT